MTRFDAVVVGAGPSGSTAAHRLAAAGASVLLVDRARFPRDKPCGGGLTGRAVRLLPCGVEPVVEDVATTFELRLGYRSSFERVGKGPLCLMTQRRRLDHFLAERAAAAGADFRDGVRVEVEGDRTVTVDGDRLKAEVVIGADGANGTTARALGLGGGLGHGVALEGNVAYEYAPRERYCGRLVLELGVVPGGYAWAFPKGDHVNFGVGGWREEGPRLRDHLRRLCETHGVDPEQVEETRGYRLPYRSSRTAIARGRAALVGDAAGLVDPLTGDGMYEAILSANLAAEAALDVLAGGARGLEPYAAAVARQIGPLTTAGWAAKKALDRFPRTVFALTRLPLTWRAVEKLVRGDVPYPSAARGAERGALKLIELVARAA
jgi:geranylgeranyl reductase family protein